MVLWGGSYTFAVDIWALECTIFQVLSGGHAFWDDNAQRDYCDGYADANPLEMLRRRRSGEVSEEAVYFIGQLLQASFEKRPTAKAALGLGWVRERVRERAAEREAAKALQRVEMERELVEYKRRCAELEKELDDVRSTQLSGNHISIPGRIHQGAS